MKKLSGIGSKSRERLKKVIEASGGVLKPDLVSSTLSLSRMESARLLSRWCLAGWLKRVKQGVYWPVSLESNPNEIAIEEPWVIAENLFFPGYIGGFSAVKHWDFSEQIFEPVVYFTNNLVANRNVTYGGIKFKLKTIKPYKVFGTKIVWKNSLKIKVSDPTKTMVDLFDAPAFGGGMRVTEDFFLEYWQSSHRDMDLLIQYAKKMRNKTIFKRLGFLLEIRNLVDIDIIESLRKNISSGYSEFDPSMKSKHFLRRWNLKIPLSWKREYDRKKRSS